MKLIIFYILAISLISYQQKRLNKIQGIKGHTFLKVTKIKSKKVLYKPCYASIETYKFYKDSIYHNWGQEHYNFKGVYTINNDGSYLFKGLNTNYSENEYTLKINKVKGTDFFWYINDDIFIDSLNIKQILFQKEICEEDINKPIKNNHQILDINGTWKVACIEDKSALLIFDKSRGYLDIRINNDYARVSVDIKEYNHIYNLKYNVLTGITRHNEFVDWLDISHDSIIGDFTIKDKNIKFNWLGFYNTKTRKRELNQNIFEKDSILLEKCD